MKRFVSSLAILMSVVIAGCSTPPASPPASPPVNQKPPEYQPAPTPTMPKVKNAAGFRPLVLGVSLEAVGPGLVVQGYIQGPVQVRVMKGETELNSSSVSPKDDGHFNVALPAPKESGTEVRLQSDGKTVLIAGAVPAQDLVGLYYSNSFTAARIDVTGGQPMSAKVAGSAVAAGGRIWLE